MLIFSDAFVSFLPKWVVVQKTHCRVSASSDSLANRGPSPGLQSWVSEANQQTFIAVAMNPPPNYSQSEQHWQEGGTRQFAGLDFSLPNGYAGVANFQS